MKYNVYFDLSALLVTAVILISSWVSEWIPTNKNRFYKYLVGCVFLTAGMDIISCLMEMYPQPFGWWVPLRKVITSMYFCFHTATGMCYFLFTLALANVSPYNLRSRMVVTLPLNLCFIMTVLNLFFPLYFYYDNAGVYHRGPLMPLQYAIGFYYALMVFYSLYRYRRSIPSHHRRIIYGFLVLVLVGILIPTFLPAFLVGEFLNSVALILIYVLIETADEIKDQRFGILTRQAYLRQADLNISSEVGFRSIFMHVSDMHEVMNGDGDQIQAELMEKIIEYLMRFKNEAWICLWSNDCLVLDLRGVSEARTEEIMNTIVERFRDPWTSRDFIQTIGVCTWLVRCPEDVKTTGELAMKIALLKTIGISRYRGILKLEDVDFEELGYENRMLRELHTALEKQTAEVRYEPVKEIRTGRIISARAGIFTPDGNGRMISVTSFLNPSDTRGLYSKLDGYVLDDAARNLRLLTKDTGLNGVSVRLSFSEITKLRFESGLMRRCDRYNADFHKIMLRVSGGTYARVSEDRMKAISRLRDDGWQIAVDDFGYGQAFLSRIADSDISRVIVHQDVCRSILRETSGQKLGKGLIDAMHAVGKTVSLTGIITQEDANAAEELGADFILGPFVGKPMKAERFAEWVKERDEYAVQ